MGVSIITFSCQASLLSAMICCQGWLLVAGSLSSTWLITSLNTSNSGLTMKLMKPAGRNKIMSINEISQKFHTTTCVYLPICD